MDKFEILVIAVSLVACYWITLHYMTVGLKHALNAAIEERKLNERNDGEG